jgi:hypothetical protein
VRRRSPKMCRWADVPFPANSKAEAFEACNEKIEVKRIHGPWRFMRRPLSLVTYHNRGPPLVSV